MAVEAAILRVVLRLPLHCGTMGRAYPLGTCVTRVSGQSYDCPSIAVTGVGASFEMKMDSGQSYDCPSIAVESSMPE